MIIMNPHQQQLSLIHKLVVVTLVLTFFLTHQVSCFNHPVAPRGLLLFEEVKTRLGSTPPSCHNKCNGCHPCMAFQEPTLASHNGQPSLTKATNGFYDPFPSGGNRYTNYKPLGWKCRCGDHVYSP